MYPEEKNDVLVVGFSNSGSTSPRELFGPEFDKERVLSPNPAVDHVPFGHWTLRDEAAQRRSPLR
jgi:hypothetical protein